MKFLIFYLLLISSINLYSQALIKKENIAFDSTYTGFGIPESMYKFYDYTYDGNRIIKINEISRKILFEHESNDIYGIDYNLKTDKIVYIYGNLSVTIPAIYNINNHENISLKNLLFDEDGNRIYYSIAQPKWVNDKQIIYYAVSYTSSKKEVFVYDIDAKKNKKIFSENEITNFKYNKHFNKIAYSTIDNNKRVLCTYDLNTNKKVIITEGRFIAPIFIDENFIITKDLDSDELLFIKDGIIIGKEEHKLISTFEKYISDEGVIITYDYTDENKKAFNIGIYELILQ